MMASLDAVEFVIATLNRWQLQFRKQLRKAASSGGDFATVPNHLALLAKESGFVYPSTNRFREDKVLYIILEALNEDGSFSEWGLVYGGRN